MVKSVLIVGGGTAGLLAAINLKARVPRLEIGVLMFPTMLENEPAGYSTDNTFANHLHTEVGLPPAWFIANVKPSLKLGTRYHWGPRPYFDHTYSYQLDTQYVALNRLAGYYCDSGPSDVGLTSALMSYDRVLARTPDGKVRVVYKELAYHLDRSRLNKALEAVAQQAGIVLVNSAPAQAQHGDAGIAAIKLTTGQTLSADLYVDASGPNSVLLGTTLAEKFVPFSASTPMDAMLTASVARAGQPVRSYTTIETLSSGFSYQFEHEERMDVGYVFSTAHQEPQEAIQEIAGKHPQVTQARIAAIRPGRRERAWVGNVVAVGEAAAMAEPLTGGPMGLLGFECSMLARTIADCEAEVRPTLIKHYNKRHLRLWETIRDFHSIFYRFNTRLDTPLWKQCRQVSLGDAEPIVRSYHATGPSTLVRISLLRQEDPFDMEGYLSALVGMAVPYENPFAPDDAERATWRKIRESLDVMGRNGLPMREALAFMARPAAAAQEATRA